jgi:hypothetical protein
MSRSYPPDRGLHVSRRYHCTDRRLSARTPCWTGRCQQSLSGCNFLWNLSGFRPGCQCNLAQGPQARGAPWQVIFAAACCADGVTEVARTPIGGVFPFGHKEEPPWLRTDFEWVISGGLQKALGWVVKGQQEVDVAQLSFAADRAETEIDTLLGEEGIHVGDVGLLGIG